MKRIALILIIALLFTSCKKETPSEPTNGPKGVLVGKIAFVEFDESDTTRSDVSIRQICIIIKELSVYIMARFLRQEKSDHCRLIIPG